MMDDVEILTQALKLEQQGERFYADAVVQSNDPETAKIYEQLADDEKLHANLIARELEAIKAGKEWVTIPELDQVTPADVAAPIFQVNLKLLEVLPEEASEQDALLFALGAEARSYELYKTGALGSTSAMAKELYLKLAQVERGHFDLLMTRYESRFPYSR